MTVHSAYRLRAGLKSSASFTWSKAFGVGAGFLLLLPLLPSIVLANPLSATVTTGSASVATSSNKTQIDQKSEDVVINWSSFNIGAGQTTQFVQPNAQAIAVNRIGGNAASQILGTLDANGRIVLINGNGMLFGKGAAVNVGALIATSTGGPDSDVLAGKFTQAGNQNAAVVNQGRITTSQGGLVALVAPSVTNAGTVNAKFGTVALGAANKFTVDFSGDGLVSFAAQGDVNGRAATTNTGSLVGANVSLTARAAEGLATGVVNMSGTILAQTAHQVGGTIVLDAGDGGDVIVSNAKLNASGPNGGGRIRLGGWNQNSLTVDKASVLSASAINAGNGGAISAIASNTNFAGTAYARGGAQNGNGGTIETSGHTLGFDGALIDAGAAHGRGGSWLLDPYDLTITSSAASTIDSSLNSNTNVTLQTTATGTTGPGTANPNGNGDIFIDSPISWNSTATLTLSAYRNIDFDAAVTATGGGSVSMTTGTGTPGDYNFDLGPTGFAGSLSFTAAAFGSTLTINGTPYILLDDMGDLEHMGANTSTLAGNYALAISPDAATDSSMPANWNPIGNQHDSVAFTGTFAGLGHTIVSFTQSNFGNSPFGYSTGTIRDIGMAGGSINAADDQEFVGDLIGDNGGTIENAYATGTVTNGGGGLVGENSGLITNSFDSAPTGNEVAGGLVGTNDGGVITNSYATDAAVDGGLVAVNENSGSHVGTIINSYATGAVGGQGFAVGGLVAINSGAISNSYATGAVTGNGANSSDIGGLVGENQQSGMIGGSYATGTVSNGGTAVGGLVGDNDGGTIATSFAMGAVSGTTSVGGLVGDNVGTIGNSYEFGAVSGVNEVGGLVGLNDTDGEIVDAYERGSVSGSQKIGGFVGFNETKTYINDGYWDTQTSGQTIGIGNDKGSADVTGLTNQQLYSALPSGFDPAIWSNLNNRSTPYLVSNPGEVYLGSDASDLFTLIFSVAQLEAVNSNLSGDYALANSIDASSVLQWVPLGTNGTGTVLNSGNGFSGIFDGLGNTIDNFNILQTANYTGVFGYSSGTIRNIGVTGNSVSGNNYTGALVGYNSGSIANSYSTELGVATDYNYSYIGGLVGSNTGSITDSYATSAITGYCFVCGGLVGDNTGSITGSYAAGAVKGGETAFGGLAGSNSGTITNSSATGTISGNGYDNEGGGLVGLNSGTITSSFSTGGVTAGPDSGGLVGFNQNGTINASYATGPVIGTDDVGGLVGNNTSNISNSYATGVVEGTADVGGLVGYSVGSGSQALLSDDYATGMASGTSSGGFIGYAGQSAISDSYWDTETSGLTKGIGSTATGLTGSATGETTTQLQLKLLSGLTSSDWGIIPGVSYPYLLWQYPSGRPQVISGVAFTDDGITPLESSVPGGTAVSAIVDGQNLGSVQTGADGYYYFLLAPRTISAIGSDVLVYTEQSSASSDTNAAALEVAYGSIKGFNIWGNTLFAPTSDTTYSAASATSLQTQDAALISQAVGSNSGAQSLVDGLTQYGYFAGGNGFTVDEAISLSNGLYIQTTAANSDISVANSITTQGQYTITLNASGNISIDDNIDTGGIVRLLAGGSITDDGAISALNSLTLNSGGSTQIDQELSTYGTLALKSGSTIAESGSGSINADVMTGSATGSTTLNGANFVGELAKFTGAGGFSLTDDEGLSVTGAIVAGKNAVTLQILDGDLTIPGSIRAKTVTLLSSTGEVTGAGAITAKLLNVTADTGIDLTGSNKIKKIGTNHTNSGPDVINNP